MASQDIALALETRTVVGKGLRTLRSEGKVPAVIHNHGGDSILVVADYVPAVKAFQQAGKHHAVQLTVGGKKHLAIIKDADFEPVKHQLRHIVFQAIKQDEKISTDVPIVLVGENIPAVKKGLIILNQLDLVTIDALPKDLPDQIEVDATVLENEGDRLTVGDLKVPKGVTILVEPDHVIAMVEMPRDQIAEANASQADLAADAGLPSSTQEASVEAGAASDK